MDSFISLAQSLAQDPSKILTYFAVFGIVSTIISVLKLSFTAWAVYDCWKFEKDETKRNLWLAVLIVGGFMAAAAYLTLEKIMKSGGKNGNTVEKSA